MSTENKLLEKIKSHEVLKNMSMDQLKGLAAELRSFLIKNVSENGGHLASNLGTVELTIALLRVFDPEKDGIVWDVGHQSYSYKILTGRKDKFNTIRQRNGLSGFPKIEESRFDHFNTGHSSTSISAVLGFARASNIRGEESHSIAVIGDGALTGGMAFEALNDAGASGDRVILILNDNEMSISRNVGGVAEYFSRLRTKRFYSGTNERIRDRVEKIPLVGKFISRSIHRVKSALKYLMSQGMMFEEMGLKYLGPVDGHDIRKLEKILSDAKKTEGPVLLHVVTKKGKGLPEAEEMPEKYHGIKGNGTKHECSADAGSFSDAFGCKIEELAYDISDLVLISPAVAPGCGVNGFSSKFPDRFFDVGIAEQHAVTMAAGMAYKGLVPVVASYSTFMQRAYDQILHDVCLMNLHVVFILDRAGVVGYDGETHQGIYDLAYLSHMPNMEILAPSDYENLYEMLEYAVRTKKGPVAIRYPKGKGCFEFSNNANLEKGYRVMGTGKKLLLLSYGRMLGLITEALMDGNLLNECTLLDISRLKPLDVNSIEDFARGYENLMFIEDVVHNGSCGSLFKTRCSIETRFLTHCVSIPDNFNASGSVDEILSGIGMGKNDIMKRILDFMKS